MTVNSMHDVNWLLDDLVRRATGLQTAVLLSADGLLIGRSTGMVRADAEHLAAAACALQSLAKGTGKHFDGGQVRQTVIEMDRKFLLVTAAGSGACLAALAAADADLGLVAFEVNRLVSRVGSHLTSPPRAAVGPAAPRADAS